LRCIPSIPSFIMKCCWVLSKVFSASIEMIKWVLSLLLLMCYITFNDLHMWNHPCNPRMKPTRSWCMIFWYVIGFSLLLFFWEFLHQCSLRRLACSSLFCICPCLILGWV
jgi:hypothetical protein